MCRVLLINGFLHNMYVTSLSPKQQYRSLVESGSVIDDSAQYSALDSLDDLYRQLDNASEQTMNIRGLYLWGKVGRGKTFLMDLFSGSLKSEYCLRQHFHHFMASVHLQLAQLSGNSDPLRLIAEKLSSEYKVLCFDEFFVSDIGDAMLLGHLLKYLFELNVVLVATSNSRPDDLYLDGLQRSRFLSAIEAIKEYTLTIHLSGEDDHRERLLTQQQIYFVEPASLAFNTDTIMALFDQYDLPMASSNAKSIMVLGREIPYVSRSPQAICFEFSQLCEGPRSQLDYIQLAKDFRTVILINIPSLGGSSFEHIKARGTEDGSVGSGETGERKVVHSNMDDAVRRFIALVDELYECKVKLYLVSEVPFDQLYTEGCLMFEFERARSRLIEMASVEYHSL
ncbi:cell division protein ZapE [Alkalimarinus alittae]|uniref:Cell division protein ZapE n=1 Tax=Alkalimarinus alittae TaxID=2961619 RepID=A0ABY6MZS0_9ALTE|nr:cell division protein ZapE [Alkalimarinus alittae]UZE95336.1 cell division protein ZapE [Alkalimarinus alittae]